MDGFGTFWNASDAIGRAVTLLLLAMSVASWVTILWKLWVLKRARKDIERDVTEAAAAMIESQSNFDPADPVNRGVEADEMAGYTHAYLRPFGYRDAASAERFVFLTTVENLRPGLIALLYLLRWKIEKTFDVFKNKLHQQKAWANGPVAAHTHAHFCALTHNLLTILLATLEQADLREEKATVQQQARRAARPAGQRVPAQEMVRHATQLTCQFIRTLRHCLRYQTLWRDALPLFQRRLAAYL